MSEDARGGELLFTVGCCKGRVRGQVRLEIQWQAMPVREIAFFSGDEFEPSEWTERTTISEVIAAGLSELKVLAPRVVDSSVCGFTDARRAPRVVAAFEMVGPSLIFVGWSALTPVDPLVSAATGIRHNQSTSRTAPVTPQHSQLHKYRTAQLPNELEDRFDYLYDLAYWQFGTVLLCRQRFDEQLFALVLYHPHPGIFETHDYQPNFIESLIGTDPAHVAILEHGSAGGRRWELHEYFHSAPSEP